MEAESQSFLVEPSFGLLFFTVWTFTLLYAAIATAAKGHWGSFILGFFTVGLAWLYGASRLASPGSLWFRFGYNDEKRARAERSVADPRTSID